MLIKKGLNFKMDSKYEDTKKSAIIGIVGNLFLLIIKAISGFAFHSQSMIADSVHSAVDFFSSLMTLIGNKISSIPSDNDHNLGHGKAEYIYSMLISISMIIISYKLLIQNISQMIFGNEKIEFSIYLVISALLTIFVKFCLFSYTMFNYKKHKNILLEANMKDHRNDMIITFFTLVSIIASKFGITYLDNIVGIGISICIFYSAVVIFLESYNVLMDKTIDEITKNQILKIVKNHSEIKKINHLNASPVGSKYMISISIFVDGNMSTFESHDIANSLEQEITNLNNVQLTIVHVNPI